MHTFMCGALLCVLLGGTNPSDKNSITYSKENNILYFNNNGQTIPIIKTDNSEYSVIENSAKELWFLAGSPIVDAENFALYRIKKNPAVVSIFLIPSGDYIGKVKNYFIFAPDPEYSGKIIYVFSLKYKKMKICKLIYDSIEMVKISKDSASLMVGKNATSISVDELWEKGAELD